MIVALPFAVADHHDRHLGQLGHRDGGGNILTIGKLDEDICANPTLDGGNRVHGIKGNDVGTAAATGHGFGRKRPNDGDNVELVGSKGQLVVIVLEEDHAFLGDAAGFRAVFLHGDGLVRGRIVEKAVLHHSAEAANQLFI